MKRMFILLSTIFAAVACTESEVDDTIGGGDSSSSREPVDVVFNISAPVIETRADLELDEATATLSVAWDDAEIVGAYSIDDNLVDKFTHSSNNYFSGTTAATEVRMVYPYDATAVVNGEYTVSVASQTTDTTDPLTQVNSAMILVSTDVIDVADSVSVAMTYALAAMQFDFNFVGLEDDTTYSVSSLSINDVPLTAKVDLTDPVDATSFVSYTSDGTMTVNLSDVPVLDHDDPTLSIMTTVIPFDRDAGEELEFVLKINVEVGGTSTPATYSSVITPEAAFEYATGGYYVVALDCIINELVEEEEEEEEEQGGSLETNSNYYYHQNLFVEGRSADGGEGMAFLDCETGVIYSECAVEALGADATTIIDFFGYANGDYFSTVSPASASGKLKNYKCNDVAIATGSEPYTTVEAALYEVSTKFIALDPDDATHAAVIAAYENGTFLFTDTVFEGITDPNTTTPKITPTLTEYSSSTFSIDKYQYGYVKNETTGMRGIIKYTAISDTSSGKYINTTFDLVWERGYTSDGGGSDDDGAYYYYTDVQMSGRESQGGTYGSFFDCETGAIYTSCSVIGNESLIDFVVYDQSGCNSFYSPANLDNIIANYTCDDVAINSNGAWDTIMAGDDTHYTKFRALDPTDESHAAVIAAFEAGTLDFSTIELTAGSSSPKIYTTLTAYSSSSISVAEYPYAYVYNILTDKSGVIKVTSLSEANENGRIVDITFDIAWEKDGSTTPDDDSGDLGNDNYYKYTNIAMNGRENKLEEGETDNGSFIDCETGIVYTNCSVSGNENIIDFYIYDQSGAISPYSPANGGSTLPNYSCDDVSITESGVWDDILAGGIVTKFRLLDTTDASHALLIAAYEDGTIAFDDETLATYGVSTPSSSAPKITTDYINGYVYIHNSTSDKYGVMKVLSLSDANEDGSILNITFDLIWEK
ncbi:MAG: hypothetical protein SNI58_07405 [Rikenellaceae bacterium]